MRGAKWPQARQLRDEASGQRRRRRPKRQLALPAHGDVPALPLNVRIGFTQETGHLVDGRSVSARERLPCQLETCGYGIGARVPNTLKRHVTRVAVASQRSGAVKRLTWNLSSCVSWKRCRGCGTAGARVDGVRAGAFAQARPRRGNERGLAHIARELAPRVRPPPSPRQRDSTSPRLRSTPRPAASPAFN